MTREDRIEWYMALGMTPEDAKVQTYADEIADDPVIPDDEITESR